jgi:hypothetical protein
MKFADYVQQVDRKYKAPVTGDTVNFEINDVKMVSATVVEHTDTSVTVQLDEQAWNTLDQHRLLSEGAAQQMAEFVLTFERNGEKVNKKFLHQPPMEAAGITQDFVRNIAKANKIHETMAEQGYKLRHAVASLVETDQLPESEVAVIAKGPASTTAKVTFECHFKKTTESRKRMFVESYDCSVKAAGVNYWSLPVKTRG